MTSDELNQVVALLPAIVETLRAESDRGCVLVASAMVESELEDHLLKRLLPPASDADELISQSFNAPISSFSQKIDLAYRIGLIPLSERTVYHQLRSLRNACAHNIARQSFDENHFRDRTKNIIQASLPLWEALRLATSRSIAPKTCPDNVEDFVKQMTWRYAFEFFFALVIAHKRVATTRVLPVTKLYAPGT